MFMSLICLGNGVQITESYLKLGPNNGLLSSSRTMGSSGDREETTAMRRGNQNPVVRARVVSSTLPSPTLTPPCPTDPQQSAREAQTTDT
ncbi:hypothetical protein ElyMa_000260900 [Elysia marginata]|uniref:Uncharacterized protein n=1 Tax=Elysia marginata TaxID=1093978 RepID=A0AAV4F374_9GAST|nr:hypothetical protein ElyMa_000260900 [Elysia marginata]